MSSSRIIRRRASDWAAGGAAGVRLVEDAIRAEAAVEAANSSALWNAQPFQVPPGAPLPRCSAGCSRAQGLEADWKRDSHGTGMGHSSSSAFWIPHRPPTPPPEASA